MQSVVVCILVIVFAIPLFLAEEYCGKPVCFVVNELNSRNRHVFKIDCDNAERYLPAKIIHYRCAGAISIGDLLHGIEPSYEMTSVSENSDLNLISSAPPISPLSGQQSEGKTTEVDIKTKGETPTELSIEEDTAVTSTTSKVETTTVSPSENNTITATTTSQLEITTLSSTDDYTPEGRQSSTQLPVIPSDVSDVTSSATDTTTTVQNCDSEDWTFWNKSCYKIFGNSLSYKRIWHTSKEECESNNAHLVVIESNEENNFITETLLTDPSVGAWIGLKKSGLTWEWHYGSTETIPVDDAKQPSCATSQKCIVITKDDTNSWQCGTCNDDKPFICEVEKWHFTVY